MTFTNGTSASKTVETTTLSSTKTISEIQSTNASSGPTRESTRMTTSTASVSQTTTNIPTTTTEFYQKEPDLDKTIAVEVKLFLENETFSLELNNPLSAEYSRLKGSMTNLLFDQYKNIIGFKDVDIYKFSVHVCGEHGDCIDKVSRYKRETQKILQIDYGISIYIFKALNGTGFSDEVFKTIEQVTHHILNNSTFMDLSITNENETRLLLTTEIQDKNTTDLSYLFCGIGYSFNKSIAKCESFCKHLQPQCKNSGYCILDILGNPACRSDGEENISQYRPSSVRRSFYASADVYSSVYKTNDNAVTQQDTFDINEDSNRKFTIKRPKIILYRASIYDC
ncbi:unnamed protein product [Mytilus coruscus]|uniref:SEA domain-containing protein n=1 Tax=Mytilus coruscus TaxID=42192 RepID=A0A6J8CFH6_MYTCO|nr:unnamed protein product [Mytilus coruscus]